MTNTNTSYWLWIEPFIHISIKKNSALLYNTLSGKKLEYNHSLIIRILKKMLNKNNLMVIKLEKEKLENPIVHKFIGEIKDKFIGDLAPAKLSKEKPIQLAPTPTIFSDIRKLKKYPSQAGKSIMTYLSELTLYINNYSNCNTAVHFSFSTYLCKQFIFPYIDTVGNRKDLSVKTIDKILNELKESGLCILNIIGGNIFDHSEFERILEILEKYSVLKVYHAHYLDAIDDIHHLRSIGHNNSRISLSVTFPLIKDKFETAVRFASSRPGVLFNFAISNEKELENCENIISRLNLERVQIKPYYNRKNIDFFHNLVFFNKENLWEEKPSQKEIFNRMVLNPNDFGKLVIQINGNIYANLNAPKIGNIHKNSIRETILRELLHGKSWLKSRSRVLPCRNCLYNLLCPPISNYEYIIGKNNLCHIHH